MKTDKDNLPVLSDNLFPVIGIGASAGGLEAFKRLIKVIPEDSGMAYVLVQHLDPKYESLLPEILQKITAIPVLEISDDIKVLPDHIYIMPSNKMLLATDGVLQLTPRPQKSETNRNLPIDLFFTSLAEVHQTYAIGVVLSGTASDGTLGLKAIKDNGGITFAQDEASSEYPGMPHSAVHAGVVDFTLPPEEIMKKLLEIKVQVNISDEELLNIPTDDEVFKQILSLLRTAKGTDFAYYKQTTIRRRILRRRAINNKEETGNYLAYLRENKIEQDALYQDLLIPVTQFFRDDKVFDNLCESVLPRIAKNIKNSEPIRVWVAGCSTGQEAYSIAICLQEFFNNHQLTGSEGSVQIFATDLNEQAITKARSGIYNRTEIEGISTKRLGEFFTRVNGSYQLNKQVRNMCVFVVHDFLKDPPFGKIDLLSCRNVLIYMQPYLQKKALTAFHYALKTEGFLLLGKSETTGSAPELFASEGKNNKLFIPKDVPTRFIQVASQKSEQRLQDLNFNHKSENSDIDFQKAADEIILAKYTLAGVVVNESMEVVHFRGNTGKFLEQGSGKPTHNLLKMAKEGLAFELRNLCRKVKKEFKPVIKENILVHFNGSLQNLSIEAIPLPGMFEPHYLIIFHEPGLIDNKPLTGKKTNGRIIKDEKNARIQQLEQELVQTHEDMRSITEDQEATNEELQSANEEMLSGSEELQSLNEELESSKEELQSANEELTVLNQELSGLNKQVTIARNYAESIIATIGQPLLVLDEKLRVKTANNAFYTTFHVTEEDTEDVLVYDLGNKQWNIPQLKTLLEEILPQRTNLKDFEVTHNFPTIGNRVILLSALEITREKEDEKLILLAIEDITDRKQHELHEKELLHRFQNLVLQAPIAICIFRSPNYIVELANEKMLELWGRKSDEVMNKPVFEGMPELSNQGFETLLFNVYTTGNRFITAEVPLNIYRNGRAEKVFIQLVYEALYEQDGTISGVMAVANEITDLVINRKRMEAQAVMVENMLMTAPGFICTLTGPNHTYELVNERYQQLFGQRKIQGKDLLVALPELEGQGFDKLLDKVYTSGEPYVGIDIPITLARDENLAPEVRYFNFSYQPIYNENKEIFSILVFGYEVTEQVIAKNKNLQSQQLRAMELEEKVQQRTLELSEANEKLYQKNEDLKKMNQELESFTYVSSHDLQEPLRKIQTFATRILQEDYAVLSDKEKDYFQRMNSAARRMQTLIEDLLAYSKTNIGDRKFQKADLNSHFQEVLEELRETILEKAAVIEVSTLCEAAINPFQFRQVMHNLISNSLKFSKTGVPPRIVIRSEIAESSQFQKEGPAIKKMYCHISFTDNGIGFQPQYKDKIFEVFQRLHGKEEYAGTGIGLAIVKKIIENHDGYIIASSEINKGATFDIYIPVNLK